MREIPPEILDAIFIYLREEHGYGVLFPCLAVSRQWLARARRVLWRHVALDGPRLPRFLRSCAATAGGGPDPPPPPPVYSLTVRITPGVRVLVPPHQRAGASGRAARRAEELNRHLRQLALVVRGAALRPALLSFSLTLSRSCEVAPAYNTTGFFVDADAVREVLRALPPTCAALELETNGWECRHDAKPGSSSSSSSSSGGGGGGGGGSGDDDDRMTHLCPDIRGLLPHLQHLSISLAGVCRDLLYDRQATTTTTEFTPLPDLRTLLISLSPRAAGLSPVNTECDDASTPGDEALQSYAPSLAAALRDLAARSPPPPQEQQGGGYGYSSCFPRAAQIEVAHPQLNLRGEHFHVPRASDLPDSAWEKTHPFYGLLLVVRDCLRDVTFPLPVQLFAEEPVAALVLYDRDDACFICVDDSRGGGVGVGVGGGGGGDSWAELVEVAGRRTPWGESRTTRVRVPREMFRDVSLEMPRFLTRTEWEAASGAVVVAPRGADWHRDREPGSVKWQRVVALPGADAKVEKHKLPKATML